MKRFFTVLLVTIVTLSGCQKDAVVPEATQATESETTAAVIPAITTEDDAATTNPEYIRLQLAKDASNSDNILINFKSDATCAYDQACDARYLQGFGKVSFSSLSSDKVALAINTVPFPSGRLTVPLNVNAVATGNYNIALTDVKTLPELFEVWLIDSFKNDTTDLRATPSYTFGLNLKNSKTFGANRFTLIIRENPALKVHLVDFAAKKVTTGANVIWKTKNEQNYTRFVIERSSNKGPFGTIKNLVSTAAATYNFLDKNPAKGTNQYRLKLRDLTGKVSYSQPVAVSF